MIRKLSVVQAVRLLRKKMNDGIRVTSRLANRYGQTAWLVEQKIARNKGQQRENV